MSLELRAKLQFFWESTGRFLGVTKPKYTTIRSKDFQVKGADPNLYIVELFA